MKIHLGVIDLPYANDVADTMRKKSVSLEMTGEIAELLEEKYHIMQHFVDLHGEEIAADLEDGLQGAIESLLMGAPVQTAPFNSGLSKVEARFRQFLTAQELDGLVPGVPTQAALRGVSHRFKHPYARREPRPSFIDTGLYESSMKVWID